MCCQLLNVSIVPHPGHVRDPGVQARGANSKLNLQQFSHMLESAVRFSNKIFLPALQSFKSWSTSAMPYHFQTSVLNDDQVLLVVLSPLTQQWPTIFVHDLPPPKCMRACSRVGLEHVSRCFEKLIENSTFGWHEFWAVMFLLWRAGCAAVRMPKKLCCFANRCTS